MLSKIQMTVGQLSITNSRDGRLAPRGTFPAGRGGFPAPPRPAGRGGGPCPAPPAKMIRSAGKWRGKKKVTFSNLSKRGK